MAIKTKDWHRRLAKVAGSLSLRIEGSHLSKVELEDWADELTDIAAAMRDVSNRHERKKRERANG